MRLFPITLLVALCLGGCTFSNLPSPPPPSSASPRVQPPPTITQRRGAIDARLERKDYDGALDLLQSSPVYRDTERRAWIATLNGLLTRADARMDTGQFLAAGRDCRQVLDALPPQPHVYQALALSRSQILALIEINADRLFLKGMRAYRGGDFQQALEIWSWIDSFHPGHLSSQRAIRTTRKQLQKLNHHPPG